MTKPTNSILYKTLAVVLFLAFSLAALYAGLGIAVFSADGYYEGTSTTYEESFLCASAASTLAENAYLAYEYAQDQSTVSTAKELEATLEKANTNFRYTLTDEKGTLLRGNLSGEPVGPSVIQNEYITRANRHLTVNGYLVKNMTAADTFAWEKNAFNALYPLRYALIAFLAGAVLFSVLLFVFLLCGAGRHADSPEPRLGFFDRIPYDIFTVLCGGLVCLLVTAAFSISEQISVLSAVVLSTAYLICGLVCLFFFISTATRIKTRTLLHNTVIAWCFRTLGRIFSALGRGLHTYWQNRALLTKALLLVIGLGIAESIFLLSAQSSALSCLIFLALSGAIVYFASRIALQAKELSEAAKRLAAGDFSKPIDTKRMYFDLKKHGENLNSLALGVSKAVDERMRSERMKTDLITNVSHDLKTPLTSIVNYVDLLKKEDLQNEKAAGYVEVLDRQSARLKKLTEDLVEASKASSGTLSVNLAPTNVKETVNQSLAEYETRFAAANLVPVLTTPTSDVSVLADGRLLWRVIDNLFSNVTKYAMPGTRVYVDVNATGEITVKNVSREALNIPASDLMERFVRGDQSRATDGSGLGLSIAKSLVELMKGTMVLDISGDLFTSTLKFPPVM